MKRLVKQYEIEATRDKVFEALTEAIAIAQWSGDEAVMENEEGGSFSLWGGSIHGVNQKISSSGITQLWKEKNWDHYSKVIFNLKEQNGYTILELVHEDIPEHSFVSIDEGWDRYYLGAIKSYLES